MTSRFETVPASPGGIGRSPARHDAKQYNRVDSIPLPSGSLIDPGSPPFKRSKFLQAVIDVLAIGSAILLVTSVSLSIPLSIFLIFFVDLR